MGVFSRDTHEAGPTPSLPTNHLKTVFHSLVHVLDVNFFFSPVQAIRAARTVRVVRVIMAVRV